jgi:hypothetical protein
MTKFGPTNGSLISRQEEEMKPAEPDYVDPKTVATRVVLNAGGGALNSSTDPVAARPVRKAERRRVGSYLPTDLYVAFKAFVARSGTTGEEVILEAIERLIGKR